MWTPRPFRQEDVQTLHALMRRHNFAVLFSQADGRPYATHLPFMIDENRGPYGTLVGHMARANPHWKRFDDATQVLVVFQGPHAYISPSWYEDQVTVPTWNYAAVHAYGIPRLIHEPERLRPMVGELTRLHETAVGSTWDLDQAKPVMDTELKAIVGFEIPIDRLEGKYKFNQNRSRADQEGVIRALERATDPLERDVAAIMRSNVQE